MNEETCSATFTIGGDEPCKHTCWYKEIRFLCFVAYFGICEKCHGIIEDLEEVDKPTWRIDW